MRYVAAAAAILLCGSIGGDAPAQGGRDGTIGRVAHEGPRMVRVPAGSFTMGFVENEDTVAELERMCRAEVPQDLHRYLCDDDSLYSDARSPGSVFVAEYFIDRFEVTTSEYRACVAAGACDMAPLMAGDERYLADRWPIVNVTWNDATTYCRHVGKRLPTEAEWEKAARGTDMRTWPWGNQPRKDGANVGKYEAEVVMRAHRKGRIETQEFVPNAADGYPYAAPPGALIWGEGPYGAFDLAGNVSEWVEDYYADIGYKGLPRINPVRSTAHQRVNSRAVRGGSWLEPKMHAMTWYRSQRHPEVREFDVGFRCAVSARDRARARAR